MIKIVNPEL